MADDPRTIRAVDFRAVFPFLHLFRAFRVAIHPSKLLLALAMILLVYGVGRGMDRLWPREHSYGPQPEYLQVLPERAGSALITTVKSGPFDVFMRHQLTQLHLVSLSAINLDLGGVSRDGTPSTGVIGGLYSFAFVGPGWGFRQHPVFSTLFGAVLLLAWSLFGGAIARIAAVHVARDEKISVRSALRFSTGKLLSFLCAPVILALFIGFLGLVIAVANLVFYVPFAGPIAAGAMFVFVLAAAFVMTLALFGTVGGSGLMYPTIAVEGSDSFDAISRSFSYFFARPWLLLGYTLVSLVYGAITYWFVKLFLFVMLVLMRTFQMWMLTDSREADYVLFFPAPDPFSLSYSVPWDRMDSVGLKIGAGLVSFWYYLLVGLLGAYAVSFYFSASTIIYTLLRRDVDATELEDVYLEEGDEDELAETSAGPAGTASPEAVPAPVGASTATATSSNRSDSPGHDDDAKGEQPATFSSPPPLQ